MDDKLSNLLIYNSSEDILQLILENITHNQSPETLKIAILDNTLIKYQEYSVFTDETSKEKMKKHLGLISWINRVIEQRQSEFKESGIGNYSELEGEQLNKYPKIILLINDVITEFIYAKDFYWAEFRENFSNICLGGQKYGIQVIATVNCNVREIQHNEATEWLQPVDASDFTKEVDLYGY